MADVLCCKAASVSSFPSFGASTASSAVLIGSFFSKMGAKLLLGIDSGPGSETRAVLLAKEMGGNSEEGSVRMSIDIFEDDFFSKESTAPALSFPNGLDLESSEEESESKLFSQLPRLSLLLVANGLELARLRGEDVAGEASKEEVVGILCLFVADRDADTDTLGHDSCDLDFGMKEAMVFGFGLVLPLLFVVFFLLLTLPHAFPSSICSASPKSSICNPP